MVSVACKGDEVVADRMAVHVETKNFIYFYLGAIAILLWKTS